MTKTLKDFQMTKIREAAKEDIPAINYSLIAPVIAPFDIRSLKTK